MCRRGDSSRYPHLPCATERIRQVSVNGVDFLSLLRQSLRLCIELLFRPVRRGAVMDGTRSARRGTGRAVLRSVVLLPVMRTHRVDPVGSALHRVLHSISQWTPLLAEVTDPSREREGVPPAFSRAASPLKTLDG
jgi:hypothetical protein